MIACDVAVLGAGGAGLMAAAEAGKRGRRVLVLEHNAEPGRKIAISGGGRCNFTNLEAQPDRFLSENPSFCISALARFTPADFLALVQQHGIAYHEKKLGQQFCDHSSRDIISLLLRECEAAGVKIQTGRRIEAVEKPERFRLQTSHGAIEAQSVIVATGGLSFPKLGASDLGYRLARQFGLRVTPLRPGLVPLTLQAEDLRYWSALSGVSLPVVASSERASFAESLLFTHRGLSGPAILQISSYWREGEPLRVDLLPQRKGGEWLHSLRRERAELPTLLSREWPKRFAETWAARYASGVRLAQLKSDAHQALASAMNQWTLSPSGTEGYPKAEVTLGGIDTRDLSSKTMAAKNVDGLFFAGEVIDVTGWLGGYNFQWAWASGAAAGQAA